MKNKSIEKKMLIGIEIIIATLLILFIIWYPDWKAEKEVNLQFSDFDKRQEQLKESINNTKDKLNEIKNKTNGLN